MVSMKATVPRKILLVEDEKIIAMAEAAEIMCHGYEVIIARNGEEAIEKIRNDPSIDLVLMDIDLGRGIDGTETAKQILALRNIPVLFLTSHAEREMVEKVRGITRYGYVIKNSGDFVLISSIEMAFELFEAHEKRERKNEELTETNRKLWEKEEEYRLLFENFSIGVVVHSPDTTVLISNSMASTLLGLTEEQIRGKTAQDPSWCFLREDGTPTPLEEFPVNRVLSSGGAIENQIMGICRPDPAEPLWVLCNAYPVRDPGGHILQIVVAFGDITEHKRAEEIVRKTTEHYRMLTESMKDVVWVLDVETMYFRYVSPSVKKLRGYTAEEIMAVPVSEALTPEAREHLKEITSQRVSDFLSGNKSPEHFYTDEIEQPCKDGSTVWTEVITNYYVNQDTGRVEVRGVTRDITLRKQAEEALRESEAQKHAILNGITTNIALVDRELKILWVNKAAANSVKKRPQDMLGHPCHFYWGDPARPCTNCPTVKVFHTKQSEHITVQTPDGRTWDEGGEPVFDTEGNVIAVVEIAQDITERTLAEEKIKGLLAEKELLLKEVHHRVKNNMFTMMSLLSMQSHMVKDPAAVAALLDSRNRLQTMEVLYNKLYRTDSYMDMAIGDYLPPLLKEIKEQFPGRDRVTMVTQMEDFPISAKILSPLGIIANELVTNAMKYAFNDRVGGVIKVSASLRERHAAILFEDDGIGIPPSIDIRNSTGFGLELVGILTEQIGGTIGIERQQGTKFILEFEV
jgi:PAS domain S-box-containing protein